MATTDKPATRRVVTYKQANGRPATTVVKPEEYATLQRGGRLITDHGQRGDGR